MSDHSACCGTAADPLDIPRATLVQALAALEKRVDCEGAAAELRAAIDQAERRLVYRQRMITEPAFNAAERARHCPD